MRLSTRVRYTEQLADAVARVEALERAGVEMVWVAEVYGYDAATQLGYLAARTSRIQLGAGILPVFSRTPALVAQTAMTLDELSGGRAILGLGTSGPQVIEGWHGVPFERPVGRLRETIEVCRTVWRREPLVFEGKSYRLPLPTANGKALRLIPRPRRERVPIYLASLGERSVELAAELAEGWLSIFFLPEAAQGVWGEALAAGRSKRAADLPPLEIVAGGVLAIGTDVDEARAQVRRQLALYIGGMGSRETNFYNRLVRRYGFGDAADRVQALFMGGQREAAEAAVPEELVERTNLIGTADEVRARLGAYRAAGVTVLDVAPMGADGMGDLARVREWLDEPA